jgi:prophage regulatory protein
MDQGDYVLRLRDVLQLTKLSRASVYRAVQRGEFPRPISLARRASGWKASEVQNWIDSRPRRDRLASVNGGGR